MSNSIADVLNQNAGTWIQDPTAAAANGMGKEDFLKLLITQLKNQDPLSPVKNEEFVAQLAQFSALEQQVGTNERLDSLAMGQMSQNSSSAVGFIGKDVRAMAGWLDFDGEVSPEVKYDLLGDADTVTLTITDENDQVIRTETVHGAEEGLNNWTWDGKDNSGNLMKEGSYNVSVTAKTEDGTPVTGYAVATGKITGVSFENGYPELIIGDHRIALADIIEVLEE